MTRLKDLSLYFAIILPYLCSSLLIFFTFTYQMSEMHKALQDIRNQLAMNTFQFNVFLSLIVLIFNSVLILVMFIIFKFIIYLFDRAKMAKDRDIIFSLTSGLLFTHLLALFLNDLFQVSFDNVIYITSLSDLIVFTILYYTFSKKIKLTIVAGAVKLILVCINVLYF